MYLFSQCDQLFRACVAADCERMLLVIVDQRARRAEQFVVVAAGVDAPSFRAMSYALKNLYDDKIPEALEIRHEGSCGRCGRPLTVPSSIDRGIGPDCAALMCVAA